MDYHGWIDELASLVAERFHMVDFLSPLGCHVHHNADGPTEISLFFGTTEILGGVGDGNVRPARFHVDLLGLVDLFDNVTEFAWQPIAIDAQDDAGANLSIEGRYSGRPVWLRILASAPDRFTPGLIANTYAGEFVQRW